jgi:outer membrane protein OmpA-like peptidoglycan-associated protein|tara:strand:+ start:290 stop:1981 length:1692 start_codon:yes stop_codon:yes gene_type:complete
MKKQTLLGYAFLAVTGSLLTSCDLLKDLKYDVTPCPLEMHGDSVRVKVDITFPEKGIKKKASAQIQPMLGSTALKPVTVQGEKATGNGSVILYKPGGKMSYYDVVAYKPDYENTELKITGTVSKGGKVKDQIDETVICQGTIITPLLVNKDYRVTMEKDNFKRVNEFSEMAQINYDKGKSVVKAGELADKDIVGLQAWMKKVETNERIKIKSIDVVGYASPEGEEDKNNTLSSDRATAGKNASMALAKKAGNTAGQTEVYKLDGRGEDFAGFKTEMEKSEMNADERNLVIRVLEMHKDPATRETEMRNMGKTFTYLDKNIFPKLRRSEIKVVYDKTGFTDEELKSIALSKPDSLNLEEMLFAATLIENMDSKLAIYKAAERKYPTDHRAFNNAGGVLYMQGKMSEAKTEFEKANNIKDNAIAKNNLGAIAGASGDRAAAKKLLLQGSGSGADNSYNMGIINVYEGKYAEAVSNFGSGDTYNKALAQILNGNSAGGIATINNSPDKESAQGYYLKAVASARMDKVGDVVSNLQSSIAKDASMKAKAKSDKEFLKFAENTAFSGL